MRHAFAVAERGDEKLSPEEVELLDRIAEKIARRGLIAPAVLFLETMRPMNYVGAQFVQFAAPFLDMVSTPGLRERVVALMERRSTAEELLQRLEAYRGLERGGGTLSGGAGMRGDAR